MNDQRVACAMGETRQSFVRRSIVARSAELIDQYADSDIGFVDASIVAVAEHLAITDIRTLDRRHLGMLRRRHCSSFTLVPA